MQRRIDITDKNCVVIGAAEELLRELLPASVRVVVITDSNVAQLHQQLIEPFEKIVIEAGEASKTLSTVEQIHRQLIALGADRSTFILGVGGGVVTDISGFVASTYMRGIRFGFVTTTLLGAADASVGGKNGVNLDGKKNMVGTFTQPEFVVCDTSLFATLPDREFMAGLAEIIKVAVIADSELFSLVEQASFSELRSDNLRLATIVERAIRIKADVVAADERESGLRRILNFGHTLAHAIESLSLGFNHGEAVAIGIYHTSLAAHAAGVIDETTAQRICRLIEHYGYEVTLPAAMELLVEATQSDKKREGDSIHIVLPGGIGSVVQRKLTFNDLKRLFNYDKGIII